MKKINCVLLIDDNPADNYYHEYIMKDAGLCSQVKVALNGIEALSYLKNAWIDSPSEEMPRPEIIFLDINMPRMSGFEFLEEYHQLDGGLKSSTSVIMLTSSPNPDDRKKALSFSDVKEYHVKPLSIEMLQEIIERYF
jgi:CheY-like chemotaxis protein